MKISYIENKNELKSFFKEIFKVTDEFCGIVFEKKLSKSDIFAEFCEGEIACVSYAITFDARINDEIKKCIYIYGVSVKEKFRGRGLSKKILDEIYDFYKDKNISFLYLVPADDGLFKMYEKLNFKTEFYLNKKEFDLISFESDKYESAVYGGLYSKDLREYLENKKGIVVLRKKDDIEVCLSYTVYKKVNNSGFLYEADGKTAFLRETFIYKEEDLYSFLSYLKNTGYEKAVVTNFGNEKIPYAMVRKYEDFSFNDGYTNMNFD